MRTCQTSTYYRLNLFSIDFKLNFHEFGLSARVSKHKMGTVTFPSLSFSLPFPPRPPANPIVFLMYSHNEANILPHCPVSLPCLVEHTCCMDVTESQMTKVSPSMSKITSSGICLSSVLCPSTHTHTQAHTALGVSQAVTDCTLPVMVFKIKLHAIWELDFVLLEPYILFSDFRSLPI